MTRRIATRRIFFIISLLLAALCFEAAFAQVGDQGLLSGLRQFLNL
ncbi:MAG: hypothetical protein ACRCYY_21320 [Trueperaceae bacterium]